MIKRLKLVIYIILCLSFTLTTFNASLASDKTLRVIAPFTLVNTGIVDSLIKDFSQLYPDIEIEVQAAGAIKVLDMAENGEADLIFSHYRKGDQIFLNSEFGYLNAEIMYNYFIIIGPDNHGLNLSNIHSFKSLMKLLEENSIKFVIPHYRSGTAQRFRDLLTHIGINENWEGLYSSQTSARETLFIADESAVFTFADIGTYLTNQNDLLGGLIPIYRDDAALQNRVSAIVVSPDKFENINIEQAILFWNYLISDRAQLLIREFTAGDGNTRIFTPISHLDPNVISKKSSEKLKQQEQKWFLISTVSILIFTLLISIVVGYIRKKSKDKVMLVNNQLRAAMNEIKTLKGILPICSYCKNIRDDKGYWNQIEVYISEHTEADLSHGICPDCAKKHHPEYYNKIMKKVDRENKSS